MNPLELTHCRELPVIISFEVHTSPEQQEVMVEIMNETWKEFLVDHPPEDQANPASLELPPLEKLLRKILIKVKYAPPTKPGEITPPQESEPTTPSESEEDATTSAAAAGQAKPAKSKICQGLSRLGVYAWAIRFQNLHQPGKVTPCLPETPLTSVLYRGSVPYPHLLAVRGPPHGSPPALP